MRFSLPHPIQAWRLRRYAEKMTIANRHAKRRQYLESLKREMHTGPGDVIKMSPKKF